MGLWGNIYGNIKGAGAWVGGKIGDAAEWYDDATDRDQNNNLEKLQGQAQVASNFANRNEASFSKLGREAGQERDYIRRVARGEESVSRLQLAQALQRNQATQQSMAAAARPGNAAMAARQAAMNAGRQGAGLAGQQAIAGIQERQAAQNALAQMLMQQRGQDLSAAQGARGQAINAYGTAYTGAMAQPTGFEKAMDLAKSGAQLYAMSDKRLKEDIEHGDKDADKLLRALKSYKFRYTDEKHGKGKQLGVMAQDLEQVLPQAVFETPYGKAVDGAKLATALTSMMPGINKRLEALEGGAKKGKK